MSAVTPANTYSELGQASDLLVQFDALAGQFVRGLEGELEWRDYRAALTSVRVKYTAFRDLRRQHRTTPVDTMPTGWGIIDHSGTISIQDGASTKATLWLADGIPFRTWVAEQLVKALVETEAPDRCALIPISRLGEPDVIHCTACGHDEPNPEPDTAA